MKTFLLTLVLLFLVFCSSCSDHGNSIRNVDTVEYDDFIYFHSTSGIDRVKIDGTSHEKIFISGGQMTTFSIWDGVLYIETQENLYCLHLDNNMNIEIFDTALGQFPSRRSIIADGYLYFSSINTAYDIKLARYYLENKRLEILPFDILMNTNISIYLNNAYFISKEQDHNGETKLVYNKVSLDTLKRRKEDIDDLNDIWPVCPISYEDKTIFIYDDYVVMSRYDGEEILYHYIKVDEIIDSKFYPLSGWRDLVFFCDNQTTRSGVYDGVVSSYSVDDGSIIKYFDVYCTEYCFTFGKKFFVAYSVDYSNEEVSYYLCTYDGNVMSFE